MASKPLSSSGVAASPPSKPGQVFDLAGRELEDLGRVDVAGQLGNQRDDGGRIGGERRICGNNCAVSPSGVRGPASSHPVGMGRSMAGAPGSPRFTGVSTMPLSLDVVDDRVVRPGCLCRRGGLRPRWSWRYSAAASLEVVSVADGSDLVSDPQPAKLRPSAMAEMAMTPALMTWSFGLLVSESRRSLRSPSRRRHA